MWSIERCRLCLENNNQSNKLYCYSYCIPRSSLVGKKTRTSAISVDMEMGEARKARSSDNEDDGSKNDLRRKVLCRGEDLDIDDTEDTPLGGPAPIAQWVISSRSFDLLFQCL